MATVPSGGGVMAAAQFQPRQACPTPTTTFGAIEVICPQDAEADAGVLWRLQEPGRQVDANLVHLSPGGRIDWHTERQRDVLVIILSGTGTVHTDDGHLPLTGGTVLWLPRDTRRSLDAGPDGLTYLTTHQRRTGLQIQHRTPTASGNPAECAGPEQPVNTRETAERDGRGEPGTSLF